MDKSRQIIQALVIIAMGAGEPWNSGIKTADQIEKIYFIIKNLITVLYVKFMQHAMKIKKINLLIWTTCIWKLSVISNYSNMWFMITVGFWIHMPENALRGVTLYSVSKYYSIFLQPDIHFIWWVYFCFFNSTHCLSPA